MYRCRSLAGPCATVAVIVSGLLAGCAPVFGPPPATPDELVGAVLATPGAHAVQARGTVELASPEGTYTGDILLYYRYPDSLRAVILVGFGTTAAEIAFTGSTGIAWLPQQREAFLLDAGEGLVIGEAVVYPSLLVRLMAPAMAGDIASADSVDIRDGSYRLRSTSPAGSRTWRIDGRSRRLTDETFIGDADPIRWERGFLVVRGMRVSERIAVRAGRTSTTVRFSQIDVTPSWERSPFSIRLPEGVVPQRTEPR